MLRIFIELENSEVNGITNLLKETKEQLIISGTNIRSIHMSGEIVWIGTDAEGLNKYNLRTGSIKYYKHEKDNSNSLSDNSVQYIHEDSKGNLWLATNGGLNKFNPDSEKFKIFTEEDGLPTNYIASILQEDDGSFNSFTVGLTINDIYVRNYPNNDEVYLACGTGGDTNYASRVEYENGEITDLTTINIFYYPNRIYEYEGFLVVGCKDGGGIYLVEPEENGQVQQIGAGLGINDVYCFEFYPIYTPNFMVGTDIGVFLATYLTSLDDKQIEELCKRISQNCEGTKWVQVYSWVLWCKRLKTPRVNYRELNKFIKMQSLPLNLYKVLQ